MAIREIKVANKRVVDQALEHDAHEAGGAHIQEAPESSGTARGECSVCIDIFDIFEGGSVVFETPFFAHFKHCDQPAYPGRVIFIL